MYLYSNRVIKIIENHCLRTNVKELFMNILPTAGNIIILSKQTKLSLPLCKDSTSTIQIDGLIM